MTASSTPKIAAVVVAAGRGTRVGQDFGPKQYRDVGGKPVIWHTLKALSSANIFGQIIVVIHPQDIDLIRQCSAEYWDKITCVAGGDTRQASVRNGLLALEIGEPDYVMIHDGVRPFVDGELLERVRDELRPDMGVLPALAVSDTLKRAGQNGLIEATVERANLYSAQTPQAFPFATILAAHNKADKAQRIDFTDDCALAEWVGLPVKIIAGSPDNIKITWKRDIELADQRLSNGAYFPDVRTGNGYDVHSFVPGDFVTLCGVKIAHNAKLNGHSDSDVALHALTDALLATRGAGDIGTHFPPSDPQWKGAASSIFVRYAADIIAKSGGKIANVDVTLICEAPKIGPHREAMVATISDMLGISNDRISIKATTNEKLGFIGRGEGIAAIATASVVYPGGLK
jgi:2-C-methyl-D-erythritol 4-phosphate cytidylyltransferase / 2-C-methyl-D-erythritol 2,4-cyclodiphosphate synthase